MFHRHFLIAPAFARLIRKERGLASRIVEGYLVSKPNRDQFVSIEPDHSYLVLSTAADGWRTEERTEVPRSQAEALLEICAGKVGYERTRLSLPGGRQGFLDHFIAPGAIDLLRIAFAEGEEPGAYTAPDWAGVEVTGEVAYATGPLAVTGLPERQDASLSNAALEGLLDYIESGAKAGRPDAATNGAGAPDRAISGPQRKSNQLDTVLASVAEALEAPAGELVDQESLVVVSIERPEGRGRRA